MIINLNDFGSGGGSYTLPIASSSVLGGVKIGEGVNIDSAGTISVESGDAFALLDSIGYLKVENYEGKLYSVEIDNSDEENIHIEFWSTDNIVDINIDLDGQTAPSGGPDTKLLAFSDDNVIDFTIKLDENGGLYYNNGEDDVYFEGDDTYSYEDFEFYWENDGAHISFDQRTPKVEVMLLGNNYEKYTCISSEENIASYDNLGLVRIGDGINLAEDGTISVDAGGVEVVDELPESGTDGQVVVLDRHSDTEITIDESGKNLEIYSVSVTATNVTEQTFLYNYGWWGEIVNVYVDENNAVTLESQISGTSATFDVGTVDDTYTIVGYLDNTETLTINVYETGFTIEQTQRVDRQNFIKNVEPFVKNEMYVWDNTSKTCDIQKITQNGQTPKTIITYFGELPQNTILFHTYIEWWGENRYFVFDGTNINEYYDTGCTSFAETFATLNGFAANYDMGTTTKFTEGVIVSNNYGWDISLYGNWADAGNGHWKPIEYETIKNNAYQTTEIYGQLRLWCPGNFDIGIPKYGDGGIVSFYAPNTSGTKGQILQSNGNDQSPIWVDKPGSIKLCPEDDLGNLHPVYTEDGNIIVTPTGSAYGTDSSAFVSKASTTEPNNFNYDAEMSHQGYGDYLCFNIGDFSYQSSENTTLIAVIQMRTQENGDWNTSHLENAYLYYHSEDDGMGNFDGYYSLEYDFEWEVSGNPVQFSNSVRVDSNTTSGVTDWFNIWNDNYGYRFTIEYVTDGDGNGNDCVIVRNYWVEGESGDAPVRIHYYTKEFKNDLEENVEPSEFWLFKNGVWIKLGKTEEPQV